MVEKSKHHSFKVRYMSFHVCDPRSWKLGALNNDEDSFTTFTPRKMLFLLDLKHQFLGPARSLAGYLESLIKSRRGISVMQDHSGSINIYVHLLFVWSTAAIHYHPSRISL